MPLAAALVAVLALPEVMAALLAAAAVAVGAEIALSGLLQQIQVGNILQKVYAMANLRSLIGEIFQSQAAQDAATTPEAPYTAVEAVTFEGVNVTIATWNELTPYIEVTYRDELVTQWQAVGAAYNNGFLPYTNTLEWIAWANTIPIRPGDPIFTYATPGGKTFETSPDVLPSFTVVETLQAWYEAWEAKYAAQTITYNEYCRVYDHYYAEYNRLLALIVAPVPGEITPPALTLDTIESRLAEIRDKIAALSLVPPSEVPQKLTEIKDKIAALSLSVIIPEGAIKVEVAPADIKIALEMAELAAVLAAATAAAGTQVADGARDAAGTQGKAITDSGIGIAAAITALAGLGATSFAKIAKTWGHDTASGARTCWASTAADIFGQIAGATVPLAVGVAFDKFAPLREMMDEAMQKLFDQLWDAPELQRPISPDSAPAVAAALFRKAFLAGQGAHMLSVLAEAVTPLKTMGLGHIAAFLADMANYSRIGGAMMGAIESQALARPFGYYLNAKTLTNRPNTGQLGALASDQAITKEEYISEMAYQGYVRTWAEGLYDTVFRALAPRQLQMMAEAGIADDAYFGRELQHSGLRPETIVLVKDQLRLAALGELKPTGQAVAVKRYTEGITSEIELRQELDSLGFRAVKLEAAVRLARLSRDTDLLLERITIAINSYLADDITEAQLGTQLTSLGLEPERVKVIHDRAVQRYRPPKLPDRLPRLREQYANTLLNNVELGFASAGIIKPQLLLLGYADTEVELALANATEIARQALLKDQIAILEDRLTDKEITLDQLRMQLLTLGITPEQVNAHTELNRLRLQPTPKAPTAEELPQLTTAQLLAAYKIGVLEESVVRAELLERKYQLADIDVLIRLNTATAKAPTASTVKLATEAEFKAWLAAGLISAEDTYAGLIARGRSDLDARRIIELELIKAEARTKP